MVDPQQVEEAITPETVLVTIMHANNEVGTIQPIAEIAEIAHRHGVLVHSDCAQSVGKIPVKVDDLGVDLLSVAGHKLYAPKGIGALYIRPGVQLEKFMHGANHEAEPPRRHRERHPDGRPGQACELIEEPGGLRRPHGRHARPAGARPAGIGPRRPRQRPSEKRTAQHLQHRAFAGVEADRYPGRACPPWRPRPAPPATATRLRCPTCSQAMKRAHGVRHGYPAPYRGPLHHGRRNRPGDWLRSRTWSGVHLSRQSTPPQTEPTNSRGDAT